MSTTDYTTLVQANGALAAELCVLGMQVNRVIPPIADCLRAMLGKYGLLISGDNKVSCWMKNVDEKWESEWSHACEGSVRIFGLRDGTFVSSQGYNEAAIVRWNNDATRSLWKYKDADLMKCPLGMSQCRGEETASVIVCDRDSGNIVQVNLEGKKERVFADRKSTGIEGFSPSSALHTGNGLVVCRSTNTHGVYGAGKLMLFNEEGTLLHSSEQFEACGCITQLASGEIFCFAKERVHLFTAIGGTMPDLLETAKIPLGFVWDAGDMRSPIQLPNGDVVIGASNRLFTLRIGQDKVTLVNKQEIATVYGMCLYRV